MKKITAEDLLRLKVLADPQMGPAGERVVFTVKTSDEENNCTRSQLWLADLADGQARPLTAGDQNDWAPRWSPDGRQIAFLRLRDGICQLWLLSVDDGRESELTQLAEGSIEGFDWSPAGDRIAFGYRPTHPDWTQAAQAERSRLKRSKPPRVISRLDYRREGSGFLDTYQHIWVCELASGRVEQLTFGEHDDSEPAWSPDGRAIAFVSNRSADPAETPYQQDIWLVPAGGGPLQRLATLPGFKGALSWSPDGDWLAYVGCAGQNDPWAARDENLWLVPAGGGETRCLTAALDRPVENMTISDARGGGQRFAWCGADQLYFLLSDGGNCHLYTVVVGQEPTLVVGGELDIAALGGCAAGEQLVLLVSWPTRPAELFVTGRTGGALTPLTDLNRPWLDDLCLSEPEHIYFTSLDGSQIEGWLLKPPDFDPQQRYPLLLYVHGGPDVQYGNTFFHELQLHAARGRVVLYTNPRGSAGYGMDFATAIQGNWGELDYQDLMAATDLVASLPYIDAERMAVAGGSYGGFMASWIVAHTDRFCCAISERGVSNRHSSVGTSDFPPMADGYWPGNAWDRPERLWQQSPLRYAANIHTPLLIVHSEGDLRCPIEQAEQLFTALKLLKREVLFVRYPAETNHSLSRSAAPDLRLDRLARLSGWLDRYLQSETCETE